MKFEVTVIKTIELKTTVYASSYAGARDMVIDMGEFDFPHRDVIDYEFDIEPVEEYEIA